MTNKEIAKQFQLLGKIMELHDENPFKIRSYNSAYNTIRRLDQPLSDTPGEELMEIPGIGKNIAAKIQELTVDGEMATLQKYVAQTPQGIVQMLGIKGLGAKKVKAIWDELGIESPGELLYACEENRLIDLKGFGTKTQETLRNQLIYFLDSQGKYLYGHIEAEAMELLDLMAERYPEAVFDYVDDVARMMPIVEHLHIIGTAPQDEVEEWGSTLSEEGGFVYRGSEVIYEEVAEEEFDVTLFYRSASQEFLDAWEAAYPDAEADQQEEDVLASVGLVYIPREARELSSVLAMAESPDWQLIEPEDIKGIIHAHSTYSDGSKTLSQMADACRAKGYQYLLITDHSQSAFYANGLKVDRVHQQWDEIDQWNAANPDFTIFKGIESDILSDGRLDYEEEVLAGFDVVIASVHSNLKMDIVKATDRLITAIQSPHTKILGHPTGRLLLSREGYPIDHQAVIDACAEYNVILELNANPYRLDIDWSWIPVALEKGVKISINPDAHSAEGIDHVRYGVLAARKALVQPTDNLSSYTLEQFAKWAYS